MEAEKLGFVMLVYNTFVCAHRGGFNYEGILTDLRKYNLFLKKKI